MSLLWTVPPLAVTAGVLVAVWQLHAIGDAAARLNGELRRLGEVTTAVAEVRTESAQARQRLRGVRLR